ncbi:hypothetical protein LCGC14_2452230, partial [marine sediment metagenome]
MAPPLGSPLAALNARTAFHILQPN